MQHEDRSGRAPHDLTVTEARQALARGELDCREYAQALIARAEATRQLNAYSASDPEALLAAADAADREGWARDPARALAGIPVALKDNIDTTALPTTGGTGALRGRRPARNAPLAQSLFDAGALLAGKANMHELAFGITCNNAVTGAVRNPHDPRMIPGGSSGGSAAAVAARMVPAAIGTDTGASVRLPAALCGVIGFRPTVGRYPGAGIVPISHTRDTAGPIARSMADIRLLDAVMAGERPPAAAAADEIPALRGLRFGLPQRYFHDGADPEVAAVMADTLARLREAGVVLVEAEVPGLKELNDAVGFPVALYELQHDLPAYLKSAGYPMTLAEVAAGIGSPDVAGVVGSQLGADGVTREAYEAALAARVRLQAAYAGYFSDNRIDAMIFPTAILPARPIGEDLTVELNGVQVPTFFTFIRNTDPGSNAGIPGISLPAGITPARLPVGVELDGPAGSDRRLLAIAAAIEAVLPPAPVPPLS